MSSRHKTAVWRNAEKKILESKTDPRELVKDPYVFEFLGLKPGPELLEKNLERALIEQIQRFLLELGRGFSFVARQKRISTETKEFFIDLVFYNYILKCFVLIDLKVGELTHQDIGQMDMYVRMFESKMRGPKDNPTIGIILCAEKDETVVKYSVLKGSKKLFASRYQFYLPTTEELRKELERERSLLTNAEDYHSKAIK